MSQSLPTIVCLLTLNCGHGSAVSAEAGVVKQKVKYVAGMTERSQALFGRKAATISNLRVLTNDCADDDWDGDDACAIDPVALLNAESFVRALPNDCPLPECAPEPDGSISLDWIQSSQRMFTMSVGTSNRLAYAWMDGTDKGHAVAHFDGSSVPALVLETIKYIINYGNTIVGVA